MFVSLVASLAVLAPLANALPPATDHPTTWPTALAESIPANLTTVLRPSVMISGIGFDSGALIYVGNEEGGEIEPVILLRGDFSDSDVYMIDARTSRTGSWTAKVPPPGVSHNQKRVAFFSRDPSTAGLELNMIATVSNSEVDRYRIDHQIVTDSGLRVRLGELDTELEPIWINNDVVCASGQLLFEGSGTEFGSAIVCHDARRQPDKGMYVVSNSNGAVSGQSVTRIDDSIACFYRNSPGSGTELACFNVSATSTIPDARRAAEAAGTVYDPVASNPLVCGSEWVCDMANSSGLVQPVCINVKTNVTSNGTMVPAAVASPPVWQCSVGPSIIYDSASMPVYWEVGTETAPSTPDMQRSDGSALAVAAADLHVNTDIRTSIIITEQYEQDGQ